MKTEPQLLSERSIFESVIDKSTPQERAAHLDRACGDNLELRREVEALLAAHDKLGSFLKGGPPLHPDLTLDISPGSDCPGSAIGPYKLLQKIGEGGMGVVFMAEQTHPVRRKVALKLIKAGMDSRQVIARFESERQALAMMDHVNIARALDAGTTESGLPYFVMELVHGVPISKYCDDNQLTPRQRLELFIPVCRAIQHAHQKGIIHRDIKPSNVMITLYDGKPVPKVIDFGVAKAIEQKLTERTLFTQYGVMVGTLEHMSPEQAEMSALGVDTRSDIYSLGVLLYELLTGSTPLSQKRVREIAYAEILRLIKEEEPPRPSTRLSTSSEALESISARRRTEPGKLAKLVRGELDWIVMKALEKDRNRRYETASAFAADVERYLSNEAVQACPPSPWYLARKFARRNKTGMALAGLILSFIVVLGGGIGWNVRDRAAQRAETGRRISDSLGSARSLLAENKSVQARQKLAEAKALLSQGSSGLGSLASDVDAFDAELNRFDEFFALINGANEAQIPASGAMLVMAGENSRGVISAPLSSEWKVGGGVPALLRAISLYGVLEQDDWTSRLDRSRLDKAQGALIRRAAYESLLLLADDMIQRHRDHPSGEEIAPNMAARQALIYLQKAEGALAPTSEFYRIRAACRKELEDDNAASADAQRALAIPPTVALDHYLLGLKAYHARNGSEAIRQFEAALKLEPTHYWSLMWLGFALCDLNDHKNAESAAVAFTGCISRRPDQGYAYYCRGIAHFNLRHVEAAVADYSKAVDLDPRFAEAWQRLGVLHRELHESAKAIADETQAIEIKPNFEAAWNARGVAHQDLRQSDSALADYSKSIELLPTYAVAWSNRGGIYTLLGQFDKAFADLDHAIELDPKLVSAWANRGSAYSLLGRWDKAVDDLDKAIELVPEYAPAWAHRGRGYAHLKQYDKALSDLNHAIELDPKLDGGWANRGSTYCEMKQWDKAIADENKAIELNPKLAMSWSTRGTSYAMLKQWDKAIADLNRAIELDAKDADAWYSRGANYLVRNQLDLGLADLNRAVELQPNLAKALEARGTAYHRLGQHDKALADLNQAINLDPNDAGFWAERGMTYRSLRQYDRAIADLTRAVELEPEHAVHWTNRGIAENEMGQYKKAIGDQNKAIELDPAFAAAWTDRGLNYLALDDTEKALRDLSHAIELDPSLALYWANRGVGYIKAGQWNKAIADLSKALELDPEFVPASRDLAITLSTCPDSKFRDAARAVEVLRKAIEFAPADVGLYQNLGWALCHTGHWKQSIESFQKSMSLQKSPQGGDSGQWFGLAVDYWQMGDKDNARKWYAKGVEWMEKNAPQDESFLRYRSEVEKILQLPSKATPP